MSGAKNPNAKFTVEQIHYIRSHYKPYDKEFGEVALAKKFKVSPNTIKRVVSSESYKDVV